MNNLVIDILQTGNCELRNIENDHLSEIPCHTQSANIFLIIDCNKNRILGLKDKNRNNLR